MITLLLTHDWNLSKLFVILRTIFEAPKQFSMWRKGGKYLLNETKMKSKTSKGSRFHLMNTFLNKIIGIRSNDFISYPLHKVLTTSGLEMGEWYKKNY